ncbi:MAG: ATP-dependent Clp protease proteolytic subunit [Candidatus Lokiarchaeota archaeon]|nr:ATP-dependent Clp protease proteolytic subunit [Candidatus Lokiarchaeota archaeon]
MADKNKEITDIFDHGLDRKNRKIYFGVLGDEDESDFSWSSVEQAIRGMHILVKDNPRLPIELHISSYGGSLDDMLRLIDEVQICPCQIKFIGGGKIQSAATWLMVVCDERNLYPNTQIMLHNGNCEGYPRTYTENNIDSEQWTRQNKVLKEVFANNTHMPFEFWDDVLQRDLFLNADEAVSLGLADNIVKYKKRGNLRKSRSAKMAANKDADALKKLIKALLKRVHKKTIKTINVNIPIIEECDPDIVVGDNIKENSDVKDTQGQNTGEGA